MSDHETAQSSRDITDSLSTFVFEETAARGALVSLDATARAILSCRAYPAALKRVLGELLGATALLASTLKFDGSLILQLAGDGPVRMLVVECQADLCLRATAQWAPEAEALPADTDLSTLAGGNTHSRLVITIDPKDGGPMYQGIVSLETASVATLVEHYLQSSEQIASRLVLAADEDRVRGLLVQRLPEAREGDAESWDDIAMTTTASGGELLNATDATALLKSRYPEHDIRLFDARPARFACGCSEERVANALRLIGKSEVEDILAEQGRIRVACEFCNREYEFDPAQARTLFEGDAADPRPPPSLDPRTLH